MRHIHLYAHELLPFALIYISRFHRWSRTCRSSTCLQTAIPSSMHHMKKPLSPFHLLVVALVLAQKYHDDQRWSNRTWSTFLGLPLHEINAIELFFLNALDHQLFVPESQHMRMLECMQAILKKQRSPAVPLMHRAQPSFIYARQTHVHPVPHHPRQMLTPPISPVHRFNRKRSAGTSLALQEITTTNNVMFQSSNCTSDVFPMFIRDQGIMFQDVLLRSPSSTPNYFPEFDPNANVMVPPSMTSRTSVHYPVSQLVPLTEYRSFGDRKQVPLNKKPSPSKVFNFTQFLDIQPDPCSTLSLKKPRLQL